MKKVIVYRKELLRVSETFIKAQVQSYRKWEAVLYGERLWPDGLDLDGLKFRTLLEGNPGRVSRVCAKARQLAGLVTPSIHRHFQEEHANIFHAHFGQDGVLSWPYTRRLNIPLVVTLHGHDAILLPSAYRGRAEGFQQMWYPAQLRKLAKRENVHFIAVSNVLRQTAIDLYSIPAHRIVTCYTGIDTRQFLPLGKPIVERSCSVLFVGRLVEMKGCAYLLAAFEQVSQVLPMAELVVIGDGPLRAELEHEARARRLSARFLGAVNPQTVRRNLSEARVLCLPSVTEANGNFESFGMVLLEAQACGVPVVTSARSGKEVVRHEETGLVVPEKDVRALAASLLELLTNDDLSAKMAAAGPEHVRRNFDIAACTARIEDYYSDILNCAQEQGC
jgi:glycosyltransferase involved in cell wall biosynthesis